MSRPCFRPQVLVVAFLLAHPACSKDEQPPPEPGPCSPMLGDKDGQLPNLDESSRKWSVSSPRLDSQQLLADQVSLALAGPEGRLQGTPSHAAAIQFLLGRFSAIGLDPVGSGYAQPFITGEGGEGVNLVAKLDGTDTDLRCILVGAHYDGIGCGANTSDCNAADDDASGVAATLAIATYLKSHPAHHCIVFALFDKEEEGMVGSRSFADTAPDELQPLGEHFAFVLIADMLSRSSREALYGATRSDWLAVLFAATQPETPVTLILNPGSSADAGDTNLVDDSDSQPFAAIGIPSLLLTSGYRLFVHGRWDSLQCIDPVFFVATAEAGLAVLLRGDREPGH